MQCWNEYFRDCIFLVELWFLFPPCVLLKIKSLRCLLPDDAPSVPMKQIGISHPHGVSAILISGYSDILASNILRIVTVKQDTLPWTAKQWHMGTKGWSCYGHILLLIASIVLFYVCLISSRRRDAQSTKYSWWHSTNSFQSECLVFVRWEGSMEHQAAESEPGL